MTSTRPTTRPAERPTVLPPLLADVVDAAIGTRHRDDPVRPGTGGPAGNARMTAWTGLTMLALVLVQLVTLLDLTGLLSWHVAVGTVLLVFALVKTGSTGWRFGRYYRRDPHYRHAGPPPMLLRVLGPAVVVTTFGVIGSGLLLIVLGPESSRTVIVSALGQRVDWVTVHQALFILFAVAVGLHVLARVIPALRLTVVPRVEARVAGGRHRLVVLVLAVLVAAGSAAIVVSAAHPWHAELAAQHEYGGQ